MKPTNAHSRLLRNTLLIVGGLICLGIIGRFLPLIMFPQRTHQIGLTELSEYSGIIFPRSARLEGASFEPIGLDADIFAVVTIATKDIARLKEKGILQQKPDFFKIDLDTIVMFQSPCPRDAKIKQLWQASDMQDGWGAILSKHDEPTSTSLIIKRFTLTKTRIFVLTKLD
jgi:hypothetical protein